MEEQIKEPSKRGRKPKDPTKVLPFRVPADRANEFKPKIEAFIKGLINPDLQAAPIEVPKPGKQIATRDVIKQTNQSKEPTMAELLKQTVKAGMI